MPGLIDNRFLNVARFTRIIETTASKFAQTRPLLYIDQLTQVNAADEDLIGRFTATPLAADIIVDDQKARVVEAGRIEVVVNELAKIKTGRFLPERMLNLLARLTEPGGARARDEDDFLDWTLRIADQCVEGVRDTMNFLACRMMIDDLTYSRLGVKFTAGWGMPSNLKVTPSVLWSLDGGATANDNADPINDIFALDIVDEQNYMLGKFDRITMGSSLFLLLTQMTNFVNKFWLGYDAPIAFAPTEAQIPANDWGRMMQIMGRVLGKEIRIDDRIHRYQNPDGTVTSEYVLPRNKVLLDRKGNGPMEMDWGNGIVTESVVANLATGNVDLSPAGGGDIPATSGQYGPLGYFTTDPELNPPTITAWGVARGFPRKHVLESTAVLTVY